MCRPLDGIGRWHVPIIVAHRSRYGTSTAEYVPPERETPVSPAAVRRAALKKPPPRRLASMRIVPTKTPRGGNPQ
jgi:hypothetical protein